MNSTFRQLDSVHQRLHTRVQTVEPNLFEKRPSENEWSVGEVVHHLLLVEGRVLAELQRTIDIPTPKVKFLTRLIPMRIVSFRFKRIDAPKVVRPSQAVPAREELLSSYDVARKQLKDFCVKHGAAKLRQTSLPHPIFGYIDGLAAVSMVGFHEERHLKQINQIIKKL